MTRNVFLYGKLRKICGTRHLKLDVSSPAEAFRALFCNFPAAEKVVRDGTWKILIGDRVQGKSISEEELQIAFGEKDIHIVPTFQGAGGGGGVGKVIIGIIIIIVAVVAAIYTGGASLAAMGGTIAGTGVTYGAVAMVGVAVALSGVSQMMAPSPMVAGDNGYDSRENPDQRASFISNGPKNSTEPGGPIPLVYGHMRTGSTLIGASAVVEQI